MGGSKGTIGWGSLQEGDIISYNTQGPATHRREKPVSRALVFDRVELPQQKGSPLSHFVIYPIVDQKEVDASLRNKFPLASVAQEIGLPHDQEYFILIDPEKIYPEELSNRDGAVKHLGNFKELQLYDQFLDDVGRLESSGHMLQEGPRTLHTVSRWGLYAPVGINRINSDDAFAPAPVEPAKKKPKGGSKNAASVVRGVDISLDDAVKAELIPAEVAKLFTDPDNKRIKHYTRLANIFDLARDNPAALEKYVSKNLDMEEDVKLSDLESMGITVHPTVIWGLSEPREGKKGEGAVPVTSLKDAYHLVAHHPDDLNKYNYLGPKMQEHALTQIPEAFMRVAQQQGAKEKAAQDLGAAIKKAYAKLNNDFSEVLTTQTIPDRYLDAEKKPMWTFGPRQPE